MRADRIAVWALTVLVGAMVVLALLETGGPATGRLEKRDAARLGDLQGLQRFVTCAAQTGGREALPETLAPVETCPDDTPRADPFTGAPYRYEQLSETEFRLCAGFETPERLPYTGPRFDAETGCLYGEFIRPTRP